MTRRKLLWGLVATMSLLVSGGLIAWQATARAGTRATIDCCYDPACPPGCSAECPPDCCPPCEVCP